MQFQWSLGLKSHEWIMRVYAKSNRRSPRQGGPLCPPPHFFCPNFPIEFCKKFWQKQFPQSLGKSNGKFGQKQWKILGKSNEKTQKAAGYMFGQKSWKFWAISRIDVLFLKIYFLHQIKYFERPCIFCPKFPIYLKLLYFRFGQEGYEKIWTCYCEQV